MSKQVAAAATGLGEDRARPSKVLAIVVWHSFPRRLFYSQRGLGRR